MNKYLIDLAYAFQKVKTEFYSWTALDGRARNYLQEGENNFSSEITRHFRNQMEKNRNTRYYAGRNLMCHFDVRKARVHIQPDIVLHESPNNTHRQEFLAEVKIDENAALNADLTKLLIAISPVLDFKYAVMIVANKPLTATITEINLFKNNNQVSVGDQKKLYLYHSIIVAGIPEYYFSNFFTL
jgi:hypothetical protein